MTEAGYENYVCSCVTSFGIYSEMLEIWEKNPEKLEETRKVLKETTGKEFVIPKNMVHASDLIYKFRNEIKARAKYRPCKQAKQ